MTGSPDPAVLYLAGIGIGLATSAPVGPVNVLAISRTLRRGRIAGLVTGLSALAADTLLAAVAAFGVTAVIDFVEGHETAIQAVGSVVLVAFGILTWRRHPHLDAAPAADDGGRVLRRIAVPFAMTVTNPGALIGMVALVGAVKSALSVDEAPDPFLLAGMTVAGVATGGAAWWTALSFATAALKDRMTDALLDRVNHVSGVLLVAAGVLLGAKVVIGG